MLIVIGIQSIGIYRYGREDMLHGQAVGYSAVLFAWMVAISVRQSAYCPIFLFPSFCIKTWWIPIPKFLQDWMGMSAGATQGLPVNLGPFVLLIFTKIFIPRSSFIGHLAGIIIGYPLAWNALNWLTPPLAISLILLAWIISTRKFVWLLPSFDAPLSNIREFMSSLHVQHIHYYLILSYCLILTSLVIPIYFMGWNQVLPRVLAAFLLWSSVEARRIDCYSDNHAVQSECSQIFIYTIAFIVFLTLYDVTNFLTVAGNVGFLLGSDYSRNQINYFLVSMACLILNEVSVIAAGVLIMNDMPKCADFVVKMGLERRILRRELIELHLIREETLAPFTGQSNRLESNQQQNGGQSGRGTDALG
jgi:hypothetical protein